MADYFVYDPNMGEEGFSAPIGAMSNALRQIANVLNLKTGVLVDEQTVDFQYDEDGKIRITALATDKRCLLTGPEIVVKKNGVVITPSSDSFEIYPMGGAIEFLSPDKRPLSSDVIRISATYIVGGSQKLDEIDATLIADKEKLKHNRGYYDSVSDLSVQIQNPGKYDYAYVYDTSFKLYWYDEENADWKYFLQTDIEQINAMLISLDNDKAEINSPHFTGIPTAPTASDFDISTQLATVGFVQSKSAPSGFGLGEHPVFTVYDTKGVAFPGYYFGRNDGNTDGLVDYPPEAGIYLFEPAPVNLWKVEEELQMSYGTLFATNIFGKSGKRFSRTVNAGTWGDWREENVGNTALLGTDIVSYIKDLEARIVELGG